MPLTPQQQARIKILSAIEKAKKSGKKYVKAQRKRIDTSAKTLPSKKSFEIEITNHITRHRK
jgi:hypothetical protein